MPASLTSNTISAADPLVITENEWSAMGEDEPGEFVDGRLVEEEVPDAHAPRLSSRGFPSSSDRGSYRAAV